MNDANQQLPLRLENTNNSSSITSFLFFSLYLLIFMFICFFILSYLYPQSIYRQVYNSLLKDILLEVPENKENKVVKNDEITTTQEILIPPYKNKITLDEAVDQYIVLQNESNENLGKINYLPPKQYTNKEGSCWIGKDRGFNSCIDVGRNDYCMSGDIYPTKDICINPTLRL